MVMRGGTDVPNFNYQSIGAAIAQALRGPEGSAERVPPDRLKQQPFMAPSSMPGVASTLVGLSSGAPIFRGVGIVAFMARSMTVDNPTGYVLYHPETQTQIPSGVLGYAVPFHTAIQVLNLDVLSGSNADNTLKIGVRVSERVVTPAASASGNGSGGGGGGASNTGATSAASGVVTVTNATAPATTIVASRLNRWGVYVMNEDSANAIRVASVNTVTFAAGGILLPAGMALPIRTQLALYGVAASASVQVSYREDY